MICKVDLESIDKIKSITVPAAVTADTDLFFLKTQPPVAQMPTESGLVSSVCLVQSMQRRDGK